MNRRDFIKAAGIGATAFILENCGINKKYLDNPKEDNPDSGKTWKGWEYGEFQVHFIFTGVAESMFFIFPDGTTMLLDCGDHNAIGRGKLAVPVLPNPSRHAGEWIARYVLRVNPKLNDVDYMMLSHYHSDHCGTRDFYSRKEDRGGDYYLSGFSEAAEILKIHKGFDRCWPDYNDPIPLTGDDNTIVHMQRFYEYQQKVRGMEMEKFKLGAVNQIKMLNSPEDFPDFSVRNICANGRIALPDGTIKDLYAERIQREKPTVLNENGMSLGMVFSYGPFRFYTAGDFKDKWKLPDGSIYEIEDDMAEACGRADVAKINHHGHDSMTPKLLQALRSRVYISCVWDQEHNVDSVMSRVADRSTYPGPRVICPGILPVERQEADAGKAWMNDIARACFMGGHVVLNVEKGGEDYSVSYLSASDESMRVNDVMRFKSGSSV